MKNNIFSAISKCLTAGRWLPGQRLPAPADGGDVSKGCRSDSVVARLAYAF